jgi:multiphosphoryl transfer protein
MSFEITFNCPLSNGIHARPANALEEVCQPFQASIHLENLRNGQRASVRSVLGLISADVLLDDSCRITLEGDDAEQAHTRLTHFITHEFAHCDDALPESQDQLDVTLPRSLLAAQPDFVKGVSVSRGIAEGAPVLLGGLRFTDELHRIEGESGELEREKLNEGLQRLRQTLEHDVDSTRAGSTEEGVLKAHLAIVKDEAFHQQLHCALQVKNSGRTPAAAQAIIKTIEHFNQCLGASANPYLQERALDIQDICSRLMRQLYGDEVVTPIQSLTQPSVVIAANLTPSDFIALNSANLKGLVLESAGKTSHTVILARAIGIPVLVGVDGASRFSATVHCVVVDADLGVLVRNSNDAVQRYYQMEYDKAQQFERRYLPFKDVQAHTADKQRIEIAANIASAEEAAAAFAAGAEGIGLFRTEMLFMDRDAAPSEEEQFNAYRQVLDAAGHAPVIIRTFDVGGDKPIAYFNIGVEENPFLGYRAVRTYPEFIDAFKAQLRALARAACFGKLQVMIPMISCVEEMRWVRETYNDVVDKLKQDGIETAPLQLGMMLEIPSAAFAIDQLSKYADFFSIGSNDLAQYFLACDRGNKRVDNLYSNYHPAFIRFLQKIIDDIHSAERWVGMCGEMSGDADLLPVLVGLGLDEISMSAPSIARTKAAVAGLASEECKKLLQDLMSCDDIGSVKAQLREFRRRGVQRPVLEENLIISQGQAQSRAEAIKVMADNLFLQGRVENAAAVEESLWQREEVFSTGLGFGIAIPHCKSDVILNNSISLMRLNTPIDWGSSDGQLVDTVFMLTIKESDAGDVHMKIFAQLARKIIHETFRESLKSCKDRAALMAFLTAELDLA